MIEQEKILPSKHLLGRNLIGIKILDFFKLVIEYRLKLKQEDKRIFKLNSSIDKYPQYLDLNILYRVFSEIMQSLKDRDITENKLDSFGQAATFSA